ncbi:MAG: protoheme IX farnesyltransferase [Verrucomicrobiota bacterium]|nr:protoheme IX farnesyltransferase [Verrucomicrobiota bacterium]
MWSTFRSYLLLMKPRIVMGNLLTGAAGFYLVSPRPIDRLLLMWMLLGLGAMIAAAAICNNVIDQEADQKMERTSRRPLAQNVLSSKAALLFALVLFLLSFLLCKASYAAWLAAFVGFLIYVFPYSFGKYKTPYATHVGSIAGAMPPLVGSFAAGKAFDLPTLVLFLLLLSWQMAHFFSIALYYFEDYAKAAIPTFPHSKGIPCTQKERCCYTLVFALLALALPFVASAGLLYTPVIAPLSAGWAFLGVVGLYSSARLLHRLHFYHSLVLILALCLVIILR